MKFTPEELEARWGVGSSIVGALLGVNPYVTKEQAIAELCGEGEPFDGNDDTEIGEAMEPLLAKWAARELQLPPLIKAAMARHPEHAFAFASPDYEAPGLLVELKNKRFRTKPGGEHCQRECFRAQLMWQLAVRQIPRGFVFVHYMATPTGKPERFESIEVVRDPAREAAMFRIVGQIWNEIVVPARLAKNLKVAA